MSKINAETPKYWRLKVEDGDEVKSNEANEENKTEVESMIQRLFDKYGDVKVKEVTKPEEKSEEKSEEEPKSLVEMRDELLAQKALEDDSTPGENEDCTDKPAEKEKHQESSTIFEDEDVKNESEDKGKVEDLHDRYNNLIEEAKRTFYRFKNKKLDNKPYQNVERYSFFDDTITIYKDDIKMLNLVRQLSSKGNPQVNNSSNKLESYSFNEITDAICKLHEEKNNDYGDAAYESYKTFGLISYLIRIGDKFNRLKTLLSPGTEQKIKTESIEDTFMDLAAYSIMAIEAMHRE